MPVRMVALLSIYLTLTPSLAPALTQSPPAVIRTTTRLVEIEVLVSDKHGAVNNLTKEDFIVKDGGKRRPITVFGVKSVSTATLQPASAPANTFSNRQEVGGSSPANVTIVLLDRLNTRFEDQNRARRELMRALRGISLGPKDRVAIYALGKKLQVLADFTAPEQLQKILAKFRDRLNTEVDDSNPIVWGTGDPLIDAFIEFTSEVGAQAENMDRAQITLSALAAIANHAAGIPGRKNLIWIAGGLPLSASAIAQTLNSSNLALYPIDARGLIGLPPGATAVAPSFSKPGAYRQPKSLSPSGLGTFEDLAELTGGRAWINGNDLGLAVRSALEDSAAVYTLGFQPDEAGFDGKYHELRVQLREPREHVQLRYRRGYRASLGSGPAESEIANRIQDALWSPLESAALPLTAKFIPAEPAQSNKLRVLLTVGVENIDLDKRDKHWEGSLDALIVQQDQTSKVLDSVGGGLEIRFTDADYEKHLLSGVTFYQDVKVVPGVVTIRVLVLDRRSGILGSVIIPASQMILP
jgi:VWFA-related protein